jgi:Tol biopolymer transport system component
MPPSSSRPIQSYLLAPENTTFILSDDDTAGPVVISPNGTYVAFVAVDKDGTKRIWVHALSEPSAKPLPGTEAGTYPFWSPDEKWVAFFADGKLRKAPVNGGPVLILADAPRPRGGSWGENGLIAFAPVTQGGIFVVSAAGGAARPVTSVMQGVHTTNRWPAWLAGGKKFLYLATSHEHEAASERNGIYVASLDGKENRFLMPADANVAVTPNHLLYVQNGTLMAQSFDASRAELKGDPVPVGESVIRNPGTWRAAFDASRNGILVYQTGSMASGSQLLWLSRDGKPPVRLGEMSNFHGLRLSPDGRRLAVAIGDPTSALWIYEIARGVRTRFTFHATIDTAPVWSPDGKRIAFMERAEPGGGMDIYVKDASGSGKEELLVSDKQEKVASDWSRDGRYLLYTVIPAGLANGISVLPLLGDRKPQPFLQAGAESYLMGAVFSPNTKWVAYTSRESGRSEVYLTNFPEPRGKWQVSTQGGREPCWRRDGKALMYMGVDRTLMEAPITFRGDAVEIGTIRPYAKTNSVTLRFGGAYDLAPDGRVLVNSTVGEDARTITLVANWTAGIKK